MNLRARVATLEGRTPASDGPLLLLIGFVGAKEGKPTGSLTDWDAHAPEVVINRERYAVANDESALQAVHRVVAAMQPPPHAVVARIPLGEGQRCEA